MAHPGPTRRVGQILIRRHPCCHSFAVWTTTISLAGVWTDEGTLGDVFAPERLQGRDAPTDDDDESLGAGPDDQIVRLPGDVGARGQRAEVGDFDHAADGGAGKRRMLVEGLGYGVERMGGYKVSG